MQYYFSIQTNGFYVDEVHGQNMPEDKIEISEQQWHEYLQALSNDKQLILDKTNTLILIDKPSPKIDYYQIAQKLLRATDHFKVDDEWCLLTTRQQQDLNNYRALLREVNQGSVSLPPIPEFIKLNFIN